MIETILAIVALIGGPAVVAAIFRAEVKAARSRPFKPMY